MLVQNLLAEGSTLLLEFFQLSMWRRRQALPADVLLVLDDDVHGHQHIQRIIHPPADVLLIVGSNARGPCASTTVTSQWLEHTWRLAERHQRQQ